MEKNKYLSIKGAVLDKYQLEKFLTKLASDNVLKNKSDKNTYPIPRVKENFEFITKVYNMLTEHLKLEIPIHPAGEWILDNYYIIEKTVKTIIKDMPLKKYVNFLGLQDENYRGFARIYVIANEIVSYTDAYIDKNNLSNLLKAYQSKKNLSMDEIWNIGIFLQISLIENIRGICEKIYSSQIQKYKVENIIERLIDVKDNPKFKNNYSNKNCGYGEIRYSFIEYMSYRLKQYGKQAYGFINVLEEEVEKMGITINEAIQKEHFNIAVKKVSMGNSITSINTIIRVNFQQIFEEINGVEEILKKDPADVYRKMDYKTRAYYRKEIEKISKKIKISEIYIAKKCLELAEKYNDEGLKNKSEKIQKKSHIGYYLIDDGKKLLLSELLNKNIFYISNNKKVKLYISIIAFFAIFISLINSMYIYLSGINVIFAIIFFFILFVPAQNFIVQIFQYILGKIIKPKLIPKLDFKKGIPEEYATMVIIPTIIKDANRVKELFEKLEVYYIANKSENLYLTLLADCSSSSSSSEPFDNEIIEAGKKEVKKLNEKYPQNNYNKFNFIYRKRTWNQKEECFLGWERKRGLINQFNEFLLGNIKNPFLYNTFSEEKIPKIKYIITLDSDTDLVLNSGLELIGAMAHILNKPEISKEKNIVVNGYALMQPRIGIGLQDARKSIFTKIYAGIGGTDSYVNATFDLYQDNFKEGIFTGKGIYDLQIFSKVLKNEIPENTVLSHDLLEGSYLKCGMVSDVMLMDGFPTNYMSYKKRLHRWIRGDYQILKWLKNKKLNILSKYKIIDNIFRSKLEVSVLSGIIFSIIINIIYEINIWPVNLFLIISLLIPYILEIINKIINKKDGEKKQKTFEKIIPVIQNSIIKSFVTISTLPDKAYMCLNAEFTSLYRMLISKKHLLEWVTAEEAEKRAKNSIFYYYKNMLLNIILGIISICVYAILNNEIIKNIALILSIIWISAPAIILYISIPIKEKNAIENLNENDKKYILDIAKKTWLFFKENITEKNNFLPSDNFQEDRKPKFIKRTSSTNIGLGLLAVISSYDLNFENLENTINLLEKMINKIMELQKWNGHLYNWYNIETLKPLYPRYISSVDSGNFVGYVYVVYQFLENISITEEQYKEKCEILKNEIKQLIENTDFSKLFDETNNLFSIGFDVEENKLTESYYDLLASEARQASLIAIAKKDIEEKNWFNLSRTLTVLNKYKGLISWSGTAFEYAMPNINIPKYPGSLLDESCKFMIMSQKEYAKKLGIAWGISESAFNLKDLNNNYQYKAFGIPWLGLKRGLADEMVVSPYASILVIQEDPVGVVENLRVLENQGMNSKYGMYEAIDYTPSRVSKNKKCEPVKTYMAHHQGLILLSINNLFNKNILQKRFMKNPEMQAVRILLEEKMPENVIVTKEKKEKVEKIKYNNYDFYSEKIITNFDINQQQINIISNNEYNIFINEKGNGYSKYKNILINRYKKTSDLNQGIYFYIKNVKNKKIWTNGYLNNIEKPDKYVVSFSQDNTKFTRLDGNIETKTKITVSPNDTVELRRIELTNLGNSNEILELSSVLEPILSTEEQDYAHPAFNNLFLMYEYISEINTIIVKRKKRLQNEEEIFMAVTLYSEDININDLEFEINKEKLYGRNNFGVPKLLEESKPFSKKIELTTDSVIALRKTINLQPNEKIKFDLIMCISNNKEDVINKIKKYMNIENNTRIFELAKARVEAENRYLNISSKEINLYQKLQSYICGNIQCNYKNNENKKYNIVDLWKFGISGDLPIILVKIKNINDIKIIEELIKAYDYFKIKNVKLDLVVVNEEKESYNSYVKEGIIDVILNKNLSYMLNQKGGIYILNNLNEDEFNLISIYSSLIFKAECGNLTTQLNDIEYDIPKIYIEKENKIEIQEEVKQENKLLNNELLYSNEYGGFSKDGKEYVIKVNKQNNTPTPWSNIMANEKFGTLVTESGGGYSWYKNARLNKVSAFANNQVLDIPSESVYICDEDTKNAWSVTLNPMPDNNDYYITYGFGYSKYNHNSYGIEQELNVFVPKEDSCKIQILKLKNIIPKKRKLKIIYYLKPVLGEDEIKTNNFINLKYNRNNNIMYAENIINNEFNNIIYVSSSEKIKSYTSNKNEFYGNGNISNPMGILLENFTSKMSNFVNNIIALEFEIELEAYENKEISIILGSEENILECQDTAYKYGNINNCINELEKIKKYWNNLLGNIQIKTPVESMNIILNGWALYQTIISRLIGRTGYYQCGGAFGFRDQLQDVLSVKYISTELMKNQILKHSKHQFIEGDVEHWWHEETGRGIRTRFSDDLLWLPYVTADYIEFTGDYSILKETTNYLQGNILQENEDEKYDKFLESNIQGTIYEHCIKAIEKSLDFGKNGLPKIGSGDWNDGFSAVGNKGEGESVWLGFFLCSILEKFIPICEYIEQEENKVDKIEEKNVTIENEKIKEYNEEETEKKSEKYKLIIQQLKKSLNTNAWDGRWYRRAFMDNGKMLGSIQNDECKIDSIAQSWSIISNMGDNDKKYISMESLENHLIDKENGIIKLLDPPFEKGELEPGYIKAYIPGTRENGGQYTHSAVWVIIAEAMLGFGEKAVELFKMINPIEHSKTKEEVLKYKVEPYVIPADVYGQNNLAGRGGWTWYTGSSSWLYIAGIKYILGVNIEKGYMYFNPKISSEWKEYSIKYKYGESIYNIKVINENGNTENVKKVILNGVEIENKKIKLEDNGSVNYVEVIM